MVCTLYSNYNRFKDNSENLNAEKLERAHEFTLQHPSSNRSKTNYTQGLVGTDRLTVQTKDHIEAKVQNEIFKWVGGSRWTTYSRFARMSGGVEKRQCEP